MTAADAARAGAAPDPAAARARRAAVALDYHRRTKHSLKAYAAGPETLDWDAQPDPFRTFAGAPVTALPLGAADLARRFCDLSAPAPAPAPLRLESVAALLELAFGLSAWKQLGPDRWAVRCNPSSGNLHPTEAYVVARGIAGLADGVHHYVSRDHGLERRCRLAPGAPRLLVGLSSIQWREAWKYGERAFRYCQLDTGHGLGALRYAAAALGWRVRLVADAGAAAVSGLLGLDRRDEFAEAEREDAELLAEICFDGTGVAEPALPAPAADPDWRGRANVLDRHPLYRWPVIAEASAATAASDPPEPVPAPAAAHPIPGASAAPAATLILGRRSAQRFDPKAALPAPAFFRMLAALDPAALPFDVWGLAPRLHPVLFVHRVEGLAAGVYALPRRPGMADALKAAMRTDFAWDPVAGTAENVPLFRLAEADARGVTRTLSCHQAIASDGAFTLAMLAEFEPVVAADPWRYRQLHWEAGLIGHVLYLEAEAAGVRGTGIGCYFDDEVHRLLGLEGAAFQSLYHFTVGRPVTDARILTEPAYAGRPL